MKTKEQARVIQEATDVAIADYRLCLQKAMEVHAAIIPLPHAEDGKPVLHHDNMEADGAMCYWIQRANAAIPFISLTLQAQILAEVGVEGHLSILRHLVR